MNEEKKIVEMPMTEETKENVEVSATEMELDPKQLENEISNVQMDEKEKELERELNERATAVVVAMNGGVSADELKDLKDEAKKSLERYNKHIRSLYYKHLMTLEGRNPVFCAIMNRYVPNVLKVSYKPNKLTGRMEYSMSEDVCKADLLEMQQVCGVEVFKSPKWNEMTQKFAFVLANRISSELGNSKGFKYPVEEAAIAFNFAKDADPASVKSGTKALQGCFDSILYVPMIDGKGKEVNTYKALERHYHYICNCFTKQGRDHKTVSIGGFTKMQELIADVFCQVIKDEGIKSIVG